MLVAGFPIQNRRRKRSVPAGWPFAMGLAWPAIAGDDAGNPSESDPEIAAMPSHIGIVACSAEGAALCYRTICTEGPRLLGRPYAHPEVSMHTPSLADYTVRLERGDWPGVGELMLESAVKLARIGADFLICPDNTIHQALPFI